MNNLIVSKKKCSISIPHFIWLNFFCFFLFGKKTLLNCLRSIEHSKKEDSAGWMNKRTNITKKTSGGRKYIEIEIYKSRGNIMNWCTQHMDKCLQQLQKYRILFFKKISSRCLLSDRIDSLDGTFQVYVWQMMCWLISDRFFFLSLWFFWFES